MRILPRVQAILAIIVLMLCLYLGIYVMFMGGLYDIYLEIISPVIDVPSLVYGSIKILFASSAYLLYQFCIYIIEKIGELD